MDVHHRSAYVELVLQDWLTKSLSRTRPPAKKMTRRGDGQVRENGHPFRSGVAFSQPTCHHLSDKN